MNTISSSLVNPGSFNNFCTSEELDPSQTESVTTYSRALADYRAYCIEVDPEVVSTPRPIQKLAKVALTATQ